MCIYLCSKKFTNVGFGELISSRTRLSTIVRAVASFFLIVLYNFHSKIVLLIDKVIDWYKGEKAKVILALYLFQAMQNRQSKRGQYWMSQ